MTSETGGEFENRTIEIILNRSSTKKFADTPVSRGQLESLLASATRAPDHGLLTPWRFTVLEGERRALLGEAMSAARLEKHPDSDSESLAREGGKAFRSPTLVVVSAVTKDHPKVPEIEQWVAVGAAVQNLWIAAESMGLGVAWKTGSHAYHPGVRAALGLAADEKIIGFIHIGIPMSKAPVRSADFASKTRWI